MVKWIKQYKFLLLGVVVIAAVLTAAFMVGGSLSDDTLPAQPSSVVASAVNTTEATTEATVIASSQPAAKKTVTTTPQTTGQPAAATSPSATGVSLSAATVPAMRSHAAAPEKMSSSAPVQVHTSAAAPQPAPRTKASESRSAVSTTATEPMKPTELQPTKPQEQACTFSISCAVLLHQKDTLEEAVAELVPKDGYLLHPVKMTFSTGESVFDILKRACRQNGIHMEYTDTPAYHSAYIEGIGNLYEFDCGEGSGWMYRVNGQYPNYGCSRYAVRNGDIIEWCYTCDYGKDIGGRNF